MGGRGEVSPAQKNRGNGRGVRGVVSHLPLGNGVKRNSPGWRA
jgi:hypothetical protein